VLWFVFVGMEKIRGHGEERTDIVTEAAPEPVVPAGVDLEHPSIARVYDYFLGGSANWAIDREFGNRLLGEFPLLRQIAVSNRLFLHRAVRHLVGLGVHQFIDIGSGVPTMGNTHSVADEVEPNSRVVYVDNEPVAVAHSKLLLEEHGDIARHAAISGDLRRPDELWDEVAETGVIDFSQPVALLVIAVLHIQQRGSNGVDVGPAAIARYRELLPSGSYLAISHLTDDGVPPQMDEKLVNIKAMYDRSSTGVIWRRQDEFRALFGDFDLLPPGVEWTPDWHPEATGPNSPLIEFDQPNDAAIIAAVGRKP
jgi:hypothetical protein